MIRLNKMLPRAVHRSPGIYLTAKEIPGKPQLRDRLMKNMRSLFASNAAPYLQIRSVGSHRTSGREMEGKMEKIGPKRDENGEWRRLHNEELHSLYRSPNIVRVIKI